MSSTIVFHFQSCSFDYFIIIWLISHLLYSFQCPLGDQLAIAKETGRRLGMGTNMYPSSALLGQNKDQSIAALPVDDLIEKADGFAGVFPGTIIYLFFGYLRISELQWITYH